MEIKHCLYLVVFTVLVKTLFAFNARIGTFKVEKRKNREIRACAEKILEETKYFDGSFHESTERNCDGLNNSPRDDMTKDRGYANLKKKSIEHIFVPAVPLTSLILPSDAVLSVDITLKSVKSRVALYELYAPRSGDLKFFWEIFLIKTPTIQLIANKDGKDEQMCNYTYLAYEEKTRFSFKILVNNSLEILLDNGKPCKFDTRGPDKIGFSFNSEDIHSAKLTYN